MRFWLSTRANIDQIASDYNLEVIDLGSADGALDLNLLYDPFHPNKLGYEIFEQYREWFNCNLLKIIAIFVLRVLIFISGSIFLSRIVFFEIRKKLIHLK